MMEKAEVSKKYYWRNLASAHHKERMLTLAPADELVGYVREDRDEKYMMYRRHVVLPNGGGRRYEFLIEYDTCNPSQGIYFGCKSVTLPGHGHARQTRLAIEDWHRAMPYVLQRLNNVFTDKDFTYRFNPTDNDHNGTFWPFWISLYGDESPREIGVRALDIIAGVYCQLFNGTLPKEIPENVAKAKESPLLTAFTDEAFQNFKDTIRKSIRRKSTDVSFADKGWDIVQGFFEEAQREGIIHRVECYESAWSLDRKFSDVDFHCMIKLLFPAICARLGVDTVNTPWESCLRIFLRSDGTTYKSQIKTLNPKASVKQFWRREIERLLKGIE